MKTFFAEFKKFITRGNVIDLAVGIIIGGAFTAIVTALTTQIFQPLINWLFSVIGGNGFESALTVLQPAYNDLGELDLSKSIYINWGAFISAVINFLIVAFVLFLIVRIINKVKEAANPKYFGYTAKEYFKMRKNGKNDDEIKAMAEARDAAAKKEQELKDEEARKKSTEGILEDIRELLSEIKNK